MPQPILIEFVTNLDAVESAIDTLEQLGVVDKQTAEQFRRTSAMVKEHNDELQKTGKSAQAVKVNMQDMVDAIKKIPAKIVDDSAKKALDDLGAKTDDVTNKIIGFKTQLQSLKNQMVLLSSEGKENTDEFKAISDQAVALNKQIDDTTKRIKVLSSDFKAMDAVLSVSSGIAGGFAAAQGAMGLFGVQSEDLQQTMLKVQSALALVNGLTAIQATLNKQSAASIMITASAQKIYNYFVDQTTGKLIAARIAAAGFISLGIAAVVIGIAYAYNKWTESMKEANEEAERRRKVDDAAVDIYAEEVAKLTALIKIVKDENSTNADKEQVLKTVNKEYAAQIGHFSSIEDLEKRFIDRAQKYIEVVKLKAQAQAAMNLATAAFQEGLKKQNEGLVESMTFMDKARALFIMSSGQASAGTEVIEDAIDKQDKAVKKSQDSFDKYIEMYNQFMSDAKKISDENNFGTPTDAALRSAKAIADAKVLIAQAGTQEELDAKIKALDAGRRLDLYNESLTAGERFLIQTKYEKDVLMLKQQYQNQQLKTDQQLAEAQLNSMMHSTEQQYNLQVKALHDQRDAELNNVNLTEEQKEIIRINYAKKDQDLEAQKWEKIIAIQKTSLQAGIKLQAADSEEKYRMQVRLLTLERDEQVINAKQTITNQDELNAALALIDAEYLDGYKQLNIDKLQNQLDTTSKLLQAELAYNNALLTLRGAQDGDANEFREQQLQADINLKQKQLQMGQEFYQKQYDDGIISEQEFNTKILELKTELVNAEINLEEYKNDMKKQLDQEYRQSVEQTLLNSFEFGQQLINNEIQNLDEQLKNKEISQKDYERKVANEKRKQAQLNKAAAAAQTIVNTAESIIKTNATLGLPAALPFDIIAGIMGAEQLAIILAQQIPNIPGFLHGVESAEGGHRGRDSILAMIAPKERVVPADVNMDYFPILSAIHHRSISPELLNAIADMPDFSMLLGGLGMVPSGNGFELDYDKLGKAIGKEVQKIPVNHLNIDAEGFTRYVIDGNSRTKYYEDRYSSN